MAAAIIASQWQWHDKAIASLGRARYWDDIEIRFPLAYSEVIERTAEKTQLPNYLLLALARQESAFNPLATSSAGAMGLMQLMPATAKGTARKHKFPIEISASSTALRPMCRLPASTTAAFSIAITTTVFSPVPPIMPGRAGSTSGLNKSDGKLPFDIWIELIPYAETRSYVRNILMYSIIYSRKIGLTPPMLQRDEKLRLL